MHRFDDPVDSQNPLDISSDPRVKSDWEGAKRFFAWFLGLMALAPVTRYLLISDDGLRPVQLVSASVLVMSRECLTFFKFG